MIYIKFFYVFRFVYTVAVGFLHTITVIFSSVFRIKHIIIIFDINLIYTYALTHSQRDECQ